MTEYPNSQPVVMVIFGASGDLTRRKIVPALYNLYAGGWLPEQFNVIGVARSKMSDGAFRERLHKGVQEFSRENKTGATEWQKFASCISYVAAAYDDPDSYLTPVNNIAKGGKKTIDCIFYLATPPAVFEVITRAVGESEIVREHDRSRMVVEKPFGSDLQSACSLNQTLNRYFNESQIYRIDHYLGKETVQNIMAFRFANAMWEPIWDRRYIDHVQISVAESIGIEHRGSYYDHAGALRDMIQSHLLQLLCLIAAEPPVSFQDEELRNKKMDVFHAIRPIPREQVHQFAVRGQYASGWINGQRAKSYRDEQGVAPDSSIETFAALKLFVDNWRWQDVPFYVRTGKRLPAKISEILIQFRPVPHKSFPREAAGYWLPNRLVIRIQPDEGILLNFQAKQPGPQMLLSPVNMKFSYREAFDTSPPEAYETLLLDIMQGDVMLFKRADQVEAAWSIVAPVLEAWDAIRPPDFPNYQAGSWGPEAAEVLIAQDGRSWNAPAIMETKEDTRLQQND